ncbi:MAG TPA: DUF484 family protein [Azospirillaceae bacterium]|nr:DUF484 family protein [Azospirillaceae bacterium]
MAQEPGHDRRPGNRPSAEDVSAFLRDNSDFLLQHPEVLEHLMPPRADRGRNVVDFQHFQTERLRAEVERLREQQRALIAASRAHMNGQNRLHAAILFLLDARTFEHFIQTVTVDLAVLLDLDVVGLVVESNGHDIPHVHTTGVRVVESGSVDRWLGRKDMRVEGDITGNPEVFGGGAGLVRAQALIRLTVSSETPQGLLALGSRDPERFHTGLGGELLTFLAQVVERCIRSWLDLPA